MKQDFGVSEKVEARVPCRLSRVCARTPPGRRRKIQKENEIDRPKERDYSPEGELWCRNRLVGVGLLGSCRATLHFTSRLAELLLPSFTRTRAFTRSPVLLGRRRRRSRCKRRTSVPPETCRPDVEPRVCMREREKKDRKTGHSFLLVAFFDKVGPV